MRGENFAARSKPLVWKGSSPHARGKPGIGCVECEPVGLIPACAGKTFLPTSFMPPIRAHPRMRGENMSELVTFGLAPGSSPHARGKRPCISHSFMYSGLIPACAGKTCRKNHHRTTHWAHPRMRGENIPASCKAVTISGSSPHARGKLVRSWATLASSGLIPACAGKTSFMLSAVNRSWAHPRMRGENRWKPVMVSLLRGSSPHARGKLAPRFQPDFVCGLIPACAGKTLTVSATASRHGAHPRMRGENVR